MKIVRKWAVKVLLGFIAVMVACTVLSRAAASALVAQVEVKAAGRGRLTYTYEGTGSIVPEKEEEVFLWEGQQVEWTAAQGSTVKKGECLVRFREEYLEQMIEKKEDEITQLELQEKGQQISARKPARVSAAESAYQALSEAEKKLKSAQNKEKKAKASWEAYSAKEKKKASEEKTGEKETAEGKEAADEKEAAEDGKDELKKQELKEAYQAAKTETEAARQEKSQAQSAYNLAKKEDAAQDKNNADAQEAAQTGTQAVSEQVKTAKKELEVLKGYKKAGGEMLAEQDCTVMENNVQIGSITTGTEYIAVGNGGWKLKGEIEKEIKSKITVGTELSVQFDSGSKTEAEIESIEIEEGGDDESGMQTEYCWYAALPGGAETEETDMEMSGTFTWKAEAESEEEYEQVIPLTALREDIDGACCLILTEKEQMLGTVQAAKRVPVTVLEKDGSNAAITSELKKEDQIIVSSEKFVAGGDRVRIKE